MKIKLLSFQKRAVSPVLPVTSGTLCDRPRLSQTPAVYLRACRQGPHTPVDSLVPFSVPAAWLYRGPDTPPQLPYPLVFVTRTDVPI